MRYGALIGVLALAGCSSLLGGGHEAKTPPPAAAERAPPMESGIAASPHSVADVTNVQQKLSDAGLYHGPMDGQWGPKSAAAMRSYQQKNGLPVTGMADHATLVKMDLAQPDS
jgi:peptidoglycan hydrolase-like protein with peptidoglycan-binding domain